MYPGQTDSGLTPDPASQPQRLEPEAPDLICAEVKGTLEEGVKKVVVTHRRLRTRLTQRHSHWSLKPRQSAPLKPQPYPPLKLTPSCAHRMEKNFGGGVQNKMYPGQTDSRRTPDPTPSAD